MCAASWRSRPPGLIGSWQSLVARCQKRRLVTEPLDPYGCLLGFGNLCEKMRRSHGQTRRPLPGAQRREATRPCAAPLPGRCKKKWAAVCRCQQALASSTPVGFMTIHGGGI
eukprot:2349393-Pyramimonas_sp.AAC.2